MKFNLPEAACSWRFVTASGPGGQHVNKASTAVELRVAINQLGLAPGVLARLRQRARTRINQDGELVVRAEAHRSQKRNRDDARARVEQLVEQALTPPKRRIATKPSRAAKARRTDAKKKRSQTKNARRKPDW